MKKIHYIEAIQSFLASDNSGDSKGMYHPEEIKVHLNDVFNQAIMSTYLNGKKNSDFSQMDAFSRKYLMTVDNQIGAKATALLPFTPMQLPDGQGIQAVYDHADSSVMFAPIESDAQVIFAELEVDSMDSVPVYTLEQVPDALREGEGNASHWLLFDKLPVAPDTLITYVDIMMVVPLEILGDYDEIPIPQELGDSIVRQVVDLLSKKPMPDTNNDMSVIK